MSNWRTVFTDSESESGVTKVCEDPAHPDILLGFLDDCCASFSVIECYDTRVAARLARILTDTGAEWAG